MDFSIKGNYDRAKPGGEAVHKSIVLNPANGVILCQETRNRLGGTVTYGTATGKSDKNGFLRPSYFVPGDNPNPGSVFFLPANANIAIAKPVGRIGAATLPSRVWRGATSPSGGAIICGSTDRTSVSTAGARKMTTSAYGSGPRGCVWNRSSTAPAATTSGTRAIPRRHHAGATASTFPISSAADA